MLDVVRSTEKHRESAAVYAAKNRSKWQNSIISNIAACDAAFYQNSLTTCLKK